MVFRTGLTVYVYVRLEIAGLHILSSTSSRFDIQPLDHEQTIFLTPDILSHWGPQPGSMSHEGP